MYTQDFFASLKEQLTSTVEKCLKPKENAEELNEAENIMFNHNVLQACWDLLILSRFYRIENNDAISDIISHAETTTAYREQIEKASIDENIAFPNICEGTQLLNSFETMLILPYQFANNKIKKRKNDYHLYDYTEEQWRNKFPVLSKYIFGTNDYETDYKSQYYYPNSDGKLEQEYPYNPIYVIRHLRNSLSHDRIGIEPINQGKEIESLRFTDKSNEPPLENQISPKSNKQKYKNSFRLTIKYEDLEKILNEIYTFLNGILKG